MGFMAGFGPAFSQSFGAANERRAQKEDDIFKLSYSSYLKKRDEYDAAKKQDAKYATAAKAMAAAYGQKDPNAYQAIHTMLASGMPESAIIEKLEKGQFGGSSKPAVETPEAPTLDTQMEAAVPATPQEDQGPIQKILGGILPSKEDKREREIAKAAERIAEVEGITPQQARERMSQEYESTAPSGEFSYTADPEEKTFEEREDEVLTEYLDLVARAKKGEPGAQEAANEYARVNIAAIREAKAALDPGKITNSVELSLAIAEAEASGDTERVAVLENALASSRISDQFKEAAKHDGWAFSVVYKPDGSQVTTNVLTIRDPKTGQPSYVDAVTREPIEGNVRPLNEEENKLFSDFSKLSDSKPVIEHNAKVVATSDALRLFSNLDRLVAADPKVLLPITGGTAQALSGIGKEITGAIDLLKQTVSENGSAPEEEVAALEAKVNDYITQGVSSTAERKALFDATVTLGAYRLGKMEGQEGRDLSNFDFGRIQSIIQNSKDADTFRTGVANYLNTTITTLGDSQSIINDYNSTVNALKARGIEVDYTIVPTLEEFMESRGDESLIRGYELTQQYAGIGGQAPMTEETQSVSAPQGAIDMLKSNPNLAAQFDAKYGAGASAQILGNR